MIVISPKKVHFSVEDGLLCHRLNRQELMEKCKGSMVELPLEFNRFEDAVCSITPGTPKYDAFTKSASLDFTEGKTLRDRVVKSMTDFSVAIINRSQREFGFSLDTKEIENYSRKSFYNVNALKGLGPIGADDILRTLFNISLAAREAMDKHCAGNGFCDELLLRSRQIAFDAKHGHPTFAELVPDTSSKNPFDEVVVTSGVGSSNPFDEGNDAAGSSNPFATGAVGSSNPFESDVESSDAGAVGSSNPFESDVESSDVTGSK